jgi:hypothetical protein
MTVRIAMQGMTDLEVLLTALRAMGIAAHTVTHSRSNAVLVRADIGGHNVDFTRNKNNLITMVGDSDWRILRDDRFCQKLKQQYSVETVKKKVVELRYHLASIETLEDGSIKLVARAWR